MGELLIFLQFCSNFQASGRDMKRSILGLGCLPRWCRETCPSKNGFPRICTLSFNKGLYPEGVWEYHGVQSCLQAHGHCRWMNMVQKTKTHQMAQVFSFTRWLLCANSISLQCHPRSSNGHEEMNETQRTRSHVSHPRSPGDELSGNLYLLA